jgi:hypothetical protein
MMPPAVSQLLLFFALQLLGSWACLAVGPRDVALSVAMGFLTGLAIAVFLSLALLLFGSFTAGAVIAVLALALVVSIGLAMRRRRVTIDTALRLLAAALGFAALCVPFCVWNVSVLTYDSRMFIDLAGMFQDEHRLSFDDLSYLHSWGAFQVVAHALAIVTAERSLYGLAPAFSVSLFATFAVALHRGLGELGVARWRALAVGLVIAGMLAVPLVRLHVIYIHANWTAAGYLFAFAALFWLADVRDDAAYLPAAFLALLAFSFARVESPMFTAMLLVVTLSQARLSRSAVLVPYLGFTLVLTSWLVVMATVVPDDSEYLTPGRTLLMAGAMAGIFVAYLVPVGPRLLAWVPPLAGVLGVFGIAILVALRFDAFRISFPAWQRDLWLGPFWGFLLWPVFLVLAVLSLRVPAPPRSRALRYAIALFFALVVLLTALGDAYGVGRYGSLTRITLHIVPLIAFYFALVFTPVLALRRCARVAAA